MKYYLLIIAIVITLWACSKSDDNVEVGKTQVKRIAFVETIYTNEINPTLNELGVLLDELKQLNVDFFASQVSSPSKVNLQEKWLDVAISAGKCKLFNVTPISRMFYFNNIHTAPLSDDLIEEISIYKEVTDLNISIFPTNKKGLAALEYLFFEQDSLVNYRVLTTAYIDDLIVNQQAIVSYWEEELKSDFISGKTISINDGYGELINSFINTIEVSRKERFEQPFGLRSAELHDFEAQRSAHSKELYQNSFSYLEYLISDYYVTFLTCEGESELADKLVDVFESYNIVFSDLGEGAFEEIRGEVSVEKLEAVKDAISDVLVVIKVDLASSYDVLISFSDADGD